MSDMEITLSDPDAVERYRAIVEAVLIAGGPPDDATRAYLEQRAAELEIHHLDANLALEAVLALPAVQGALLRIEMERADARQAQHQQQERITQLESKLRAEQKRGSKLEDELRVERLYHLTTREELEVRTMELEGLQTLHENTLTQMASLRRQLAVAELKPGDAPSVTAPTEVGKKRRKSL